MKKQHFVIFVVAITGLLIIQALLAAAVYFLQPDWPSRGQFGDMFGGINAFFSACAFAGIIFTIFLQREELELQRQELALTRTELKRSALAQEKSESALSCQAKAADITSQLSAINYLIQYTSDELNRLHADEITERLNADKIEELEKKRKLLAARLNVTFNQVIRQTRLKE